MYNIKWATAKQFYSTNKAYDLTIAPYVSLLNVTDDIIFLCVKHSCDYYMIHSEKPELMQWS